MRKHQVVRNHIRHQWKSARSILEYLLTEESIDESKYDEMYEQKVITHNLKSTKVQIIDDLR